MCRQKKLWIWILEDHNDNVYANDLLSAWISVITSHYFTRYAGFCRRPKLSSENSYHKLPSATFLAPSHPEYPWTRTHGPMVRVHIIIRQGFANDGCNRREALASGSKYVIDYRPQIPKASLEPPYWNRFCWKRTEQPSQREHPRHQG